MAAHASKALGLGGNGGYGLFIVICLRGIGGERVCTRVGGCGGRDEGVRNGWLYPTTGYARLNRGISARHHVNSTRAVDCKGSRNGRGVMHSHTATTMPMFIHLQIDVGARNHCPERRLFVWMCALPQSDLGTVPQLNVRHQPTCATTDEAHDSLSHLRLA